MLQMIRLCRSLFLLLNSAYANVDRHRLTFSFQNSDCLFLRYRGKEAEKRLIFMVLSIIVC